MSGVSLERQETLPKYVSYSREMALGPLLWRVGFNNEDTRKKLFSRMQEYKPPAYIAWQVVRNLTGPQLVDNSFVPLIGTEGYFAGIASRAEEIITKEAEIGQGMLDLMVKLHSDWNLRNRMRKAAFGIEYQPTALIALNSMVGAELARLRAMKWNYPPPVRLVNDNFRARNYNIAYGLPPTQYSLSEDGRVVVTHTLPGQTSLANHSNYDTLPLNEKQQESFAFFDGACRLTMPFIRAALSML